MYFALKQYGNSWLPFMRGGELILWETLDSFGTMLEDPKIKIFSLDHTIAQQLIVSNKLAQAINEIDKSIEKVKRLEEINKSTTGEPQQP